VLLHDRQSAQALPGFLDTLDVYLTQAKKQGFAFHALELDVLKRGPAATEGGQDAGSWQSSPESWRSGVSER
jgi:hypothetical protein